MERLMGRLVADKIHQAGLPAELCAAGYEVDVCPDDLIEDPGLHKFAFIEASRDTDEELAEEMFRELEHIGKRHGYVRCLECGLIPDDHIPHNYDTPWWRDRRAREMDDTSPPTSDEVNAAIEDLIAEEEGAAPPKNNFRELYECLACSPTDELEGVGYGLTPAEAKAVAWITACAWEDTIPTLGLRNRRLMGDPDLMDAFIELVRSGEVVNSGRRRNGKIVWVLKQYAGGHSEC